jgi:protein transport protein SEC23
MSYTQEHTSLLILYFQVHELGFGILPKSYVFKGTKEVTKEQILDQMGFFSGKKKPSVGVIAGARDGLTSESISRFLLPASECEFVLDSV